MSTPENGSPLLVCSACGRPAEPGQHVCEHCGAPMTPYAHTDPVMGIMARGFAAHKATTDPQKPIVVIGMWLWMVPLLIVGLFMIRGGVGIVLEGVIEREWAGFVGLFVTVVGLAMVWIAGGILWKTTLRYLETNSGEEASEQDEVKVDCLQCGESFAAEANTCPKCGWTYTGVEED
jgi:ribosomal protein L40E